MRGNSKSHNMFCFPLFLPTPSQLPYKQLKEVQNTLEMVQGQRNDLRQEVKDLKAALGVAQAALQVN